MDRTCPRGEAEEEEEGDAKSASWRATAESDEH